MKKFNRIKKIKGKEYIYEITPYYDPETKTIKQRSKYLGKNVTGKPIKVRSQTTPLISTPKKILSYGEHLPLIKIINDLELEDLLSRVLPKEHVWTALTIALNYIIKPLASSHIQSWYEGTILSETHPDLPISSQSISKLFDQIGTSSTHIDFSNNLIQKISTSKTLVYDITSVSSYSQTIDFLEWGYNRDGLDLPQINLSLVVDKEREIPIMYDLYPGSIVDVSTLKNTIKKIQACGIQDYTLIMDRGFFSTTNLEEMVNSGLSFIMPPSTSMKTVKEAISIIHSSISNPNNLKIYHNEPLFVSPVTIDVGNLSVEGYAYYDQKREQQDRQSFYRRLYDTVESLKKIEIRSWMNPLDVFKEIAKKNAQYIDWKVNNNRFEVELKKNAVSQRVNRMGRFILLYRGNFGWEECLSLYRSKDIVEKGFDILKNELDVMPANVRKDSTLKGYLFISFLSLILRMRLMKLMREGDLVSKYSVEALVTELEKNRVMILPDGSQIVTEPTKRQKEIFKVLCA